MATHRNRFVKVSLFTPSTTRLEGAMVVGQSDEYLILERAQPKPRQADAKPRKRRAVKANAGAHATESASAQVS